MIIHQYVQLFRYHDSWRIRAKAIAARCHEFSAFVMRHEGETAVQVG